MEDMVEITLPDDLEGVASSILGLGAPPGHLLKQHLLPVHILALTLVTMDLETLVTWQILGLLLCTARTRATNLIPLASMGSSSYN